MGIGAGMARPAAAAVGPSAKVRGAELFATRGCAHCHGQAGVGGAKGPDLQLVRKRLKRSQMANQIHDGGKGMPAYGDLLSRAEIDGLVAYLKAKRKIVGVPPTQPAAGR